MPWRRSKHGQEKVERKTPRIPKEPSQTHTKEELPINRMPESDALSNKELPDNLTTLEIQQEIIRMCGQLDGRFTGVFETNKNNFTGTKRALIPWAHLDFLSDRVAYIQKLASKLK